MKLYTEEQLLNTIEAIRDYLKNYPEKFHESMIEKHLKNLTPIELPSDEDIDVHVEDDFLNATEVHKYSKEAQLLMKAMCKAGALWMRDKIGGNK